MEVDHKESGVLEGQEEAGNLQSIFARDENEFVWEAVDSVDAAGAGNISLSTRFQLVDFEFSSTHIHPQKPLAEGWTLMPPPSLILPRLAHHVAACHSLTGVLHGENVDLEEVANDGDEGVAEA
eukprot:CAMPEP_0170600216 /NCGR_PEP_ID=MMETSP0224-20130122/17218_1 /TAXON_ID=285029 /ORGANISM="Togula jolla, Strain CCCM 725" /LENGTH=123 /DNA_ID=CAMNT_0010924931 /DNA_START=732 /DNA_END=1104 /DNA_ORIENTATION=+